MRRKVIAGNWKMNMLPNEPINFIDEFAPMVKDTKHEVILCVPYTDLFYALLNVQGTNIKIGAQNMHWEEKGAYTGEVSGQMLKSIGVEYARSHEKAYLYTKERTKELEILSVFLCENTDEIFEMGEKTWEYSKTEEIVRNLKNRRTGILG